MGALIRIAWNVSENILAKQPHMNNGRDIGPSVIIVTRIFFAWLVHQNSTKLKLNKRGTRLERREAAGQLTV